MNENESPNGSYHPLSKQPKEHNRGWHFPPCIVRLWDEQKLNDGEFTFLGIINALQDPKMGGCWASNEYLARRWHRVGRSVQRLIQYFIELGLLKSKMVKSSTGTLRILRVTFQGDDIAGMSEWEENNQGVGTRMSRGGRDTHVPEVRNKFLVTAKKENCGRKDPATVFGENGGESPFIVTCANKLENFVRSSRQLDGRRHNPKDWFKHLRLLLQDLGGNKQRLKEVLQCYISKPHDKYTPMILSARALRDKWPQIERWAGHILPPKPEIKVVEVEYKAPRR